MKHIIVVEDPSDESSVAEIEKNLVEFNTRLAGERHRKNFCLTVRNEEGELLAGLTAVVSFGWLYVDCLWVAEACRGQGVGERLIAQAEELGRSRGCHHAYLFSYSFQAPDFYKKQGYEEFARLDDFPLGHARVYFRKAL